MKQGAPGWARPVFVCVGEVGNLDSSVKELE